MNRLTIAFLAAGFAIAVLGCEAPEAPTLDNPYDSGDGIFLLPPKDLSLYSGSYFSLVITWTQGSTTATGYSVERSISWGAFQEVFQGTLTQNFYTENTPATNELYRFRIRSLQGTAKGIPSSILTLKYGVSAIGYVSGRIAGLTGRIQSMAFNNAGTILAAGDDAGFIRTTPATQSLNDSIGVPIVSMQFAPTSGVLVYAGLDSTVHFSAGIPIKLPASPSTLGISGDLVACGLTSGNVELYSLSTRSHVQTISGHTGTVTGVAFSPDGTLLVTAAGDGKAIVWSLSSFTSLHTFTGLQSPAVAFAPNGEKFALIDNSSKTVTWEKITDFSESGSFSTGMTLLNGFALNNDSFSCAAVGSGPVIRVWEQSGISTVSPLPSLQETELTAVTFGAFGTRLAIGGTGGFVNIWSITSGWQDVRQ